MRIAFIEPHLRCFGGIRRVLEFSNWLVELGHDVSLYVPLEVVNEPHWMPVQATVCALREEHPEPLDVLVFNHEPQWYVLDRFQNVGIRVFYALHYAALYHKAGVYESLRVPVDLVLANSQWTADQVARDGGQEATVQLGGVNPSHFQPVDGPKKYPVLAYGDRRREWKGTSTIDEACRRLSIEPHYYAGKGYPQSRMGRVYSSAEVFVTGSWFEGFCQPGLEALACGVPLVTTDCGGAREYAIHEETALVVPPKDSVAMADSIDRLRKDQGLALRLRKNGLDLVAKIFDWEAQTRKLAERFEEALATKKEAPRRSDSDAKSSDMEPRLSIITLAWNQLPLTQDCVESVRRQTKSSYELILVDNGSEFEARSYAAQAGDEVILNPTNRGFSEGMNQGLEKARGEYVVFLNNDTKLPLDWDLPLLGALEKDPLVGIVVPLVTAGGSEFTVRDKPGTECWEALPFEQAPAAVVYAMRREVALRLGGFGDEYPVASAEDVDLCFKVWCNGLAVVIDERVLVEHVSKGTARRLEDWESTWEDNRRRFLEKWSDPEVSVPFIQAISGDEFRRLKRAGVGAARWMQKYFWALDHLRGGEKRKQRRLEVKEGARPVDWKRDSRGRRRFWHKKWNSLRKRLRR